MGQINEHIAMCAALTASLSGRSTFTGAFPDGTTRAEIMPTTIKLRICPNECGFAAALTNDAAIKNFGENLSLALEYNLTRHHHSTVSHNTQSGRFEVCISSPLGSNRMEMVQTGILPALAGFLRWADAEVLATLRQPPRPGSSQH